MQILGITWKWNIPNALSVLRLVLIPVFATLYFCDYSMAAFAVLLFSGVTDLLDGVIARKCNQITDCGKLLDPLADKLTQVAVLVCLALRYHNLLPLMGLCLVKEACQAIGGIILLRKNAAVRGSKWFGKVSTVVFYACMLALVLWQDTMHPVLLWGVIGLAGATMLAAFFGYFRLFILIYREEKQKQQVQVTPAATPEKG